MQKLPPLPSSEDQEVFDGDNHKIERLSLADIVCAKCNYVIDFVNREANCLACGRGFSFSVHLVDYKDGHLCDKAGKQLT